MERATTMSEYEAMNRDLTSALDKLRQDRDDWKDLAEKAIAQIEEWRALCDIYQERYNQIVRGN
jgi:hypothetical protein